MLLLLAACRVVDAPEEVEALMRFGFVEFEDPRVRAAVVEALIPELDRHGDELRDGMRANELTEADLRQAGVDLRGSIEILGAVGVVDYAHPIDDVVGVITHPHKDRVFEATEAYEVTAQSDRPCFLDQDCETLFQEVTETSSVPLLGQSVQERRTELAWTETPDGRPAMVSRTLAPDPIVFNTNLVAVHQQYGFVVILSAGSGALRTEAFWVDATVIGLDVPDRFAVDSAVNAMQDYADEVDAWLDR